jgi:hypothetical protein
MKLTCPMCGNPILVEKAPIEGAYCSTCKIWVRTTYKEE